MPNSLWHKLHWRLPVFPENISVSRACCRLEIMCVSYWGLAKLIALFLMMSIVITAATGVSVWLIMK